MIWTWRVRQVLLLGAIALLLFAVTISRELAGTLQSTLVRAHVESELVAKGLIRDLTSLAAEHPQAEIRELARHPAISASILDAQVSAPSVLHVALYDAQGVIVAHTLPQLIGEIVEPMPLLPETPGTLDALATFWSLWRDPIDYATEWPLVSEDSNPVAAIRVASGGAFLLHDTRQALRRGVVTLLLLLLLSLAAGALASRSVGTQLRRLEASVTALREGASHEALPESGWDEFGQLARELNLLGERFRDDDSTRGDPLAEEGLLGRGGIMVLDHEDRVVFETRGFWRHLGVEGGIGWNLAELVPTNHPLSRLTHQLRQGGPRVQSARLVAEAESVSQILIVHRIEDPDRRDGVLAEIKAQQAHEHLQGLVHNSIALSRLGDMVAGVAHEVRGPLQGIEFDLDALESSIDDPERARTMLSDLQQKIQRLEWVVSGFLKVARVKPMKSDVILAADLIGEACENLQTDALMGGVTLEIVAGDPELALLGDREALARALENVISNAIEAQPSRDGVVQVRWGKDGDQVEFTVSDTGPGIEAERTEAVFDLYFTTKPHGTGVGLALVRQTMDLHDGDVRIVSRVGEGTRLCLYLPSAQLT